jgi:hypothetical protein
VIPLKLMIPLKPHDFAVKTGRPRLVARLLAVVLAAVLAAGLATACGTKASSATSSASASSGTPTRSSTPTSRPSTKPTSAVTMPPLIGTPQSLAIRQLAADGLGPVKVSRSANLYFGAGRVLATSPPGGDVARPGVAVIVYVSLGAEFCAVGCLASPIVRLSMPDVCGLTFQEAATKLVARGITLRPPDGNLDPKGRVTGSAPAAGKRFIAYGSKAARKVVVTLATVSPGAATAGPSC